MLSNALQRAFKWISDLDCRPSMLPAWPAKSNVSMLASCCCNLFSCLLGCCCNGTADTKYFATFAYHLCLYASPQPASFQNKLILLHQGARPSEDTHNYKPVQLRGGTRSRRRVTLEAMYLITSDPLGRDPT